MIRVLGGLVGVPDKADALAGELEAGLEQIRAAGGTVLRRRPRVYFEEWDNPLISGIQWVEELIEIAGGDPVFPAAASRAARQGPHRLERAGDRRGARRDHRIVVRQARAKREDRARDRDGT